MLYFFQNQQEVANKKKANNEKYPNKQESVECDSEDQHQEYQNNQHKMMHHSENTYGLPDDVDDTITDTEQKIMDQTQCYDLQLIRSFLEANNYDIHQTIDSIINYVVHEHKSKFSHIIIYFIKI